MVIIWDNHLDWPSLSDKLYELEQESAAIIEEEQKTQEQLEKLEAKQLEAKTKLDEIRVMVEIRLKTNPTNVHQDVLAFFKHQRPLEMELLNRYYTIVTPNEPLNLANVEFREWKAEGYNCSGTVLKKTGKPHGVVRLIWPKDHIIERTYKNGVENGLSRKVDKDRTTIQLFRSGQMIATFNFGKNFREGLGRSGSGKLMIASLTAEYFRLTGLQRWRELA